MVDIHSDLPGKPLVEAILELRWELTENKDPAFPLYAGVLAGAVAESFPFHERLPAADVPDEVTPYIVKLRLRSGKGEWPVIQAGPGIATLNFTHNYSWRPFRAQAEALWDHLIESYKVVNSRQSPRFNIVQLRYLNAALLHDENPLEFVESKLHASLRLPKEVFSVATGPASDIGLVLKLPFAQAGTVGTIRIQSGKQAGADAMLWDLAAEGRLDPTFGKAAFMDWLDASHSALEGWFFTLVDGELLDLFLGSGLGDADAG
jgi:uncharacterized protein (TIGR04255 family)